MFVFAFFQTENFTCTHEGHCLWMKHDTSHGFQIWKSCVAERMNVDNEWVDDIYRTNPRINLSYPPISPSPLTTIMLYTRISRFMWISLHGHGYQIMIWKIMEKFWSVVHIDLLGFLLIPIFHSLKLHHSNAIWNLVNCHVPGQEGVIRFCMRSTIISFTFVTFFIFLLNWCD